MELNYFKNELKHKCKSYFKHSIIAGFEIHTQINIALGVTEEAGDIDDLKSEIESAKTEFTALKSEINSLENDAVWSDFQTDSDANMMAFVSSKMPGLTTERQKLAVVIAVQNIR